MEHINVPLVFGRQDLGNRQEVYTHQEAAAPNQFYRMAGPNGLKQEVLAWIRNTAGNVHTGDRMTIILLGHGDEEGGLKVTTRGRNEVLGKSEVVAALSRLPQNVRVLIMVEACYSGSWGCIASQQQAGANDTLIEAAGRSDEKSENWYSGSWTFRCSLFGMAWLREITTHPEGRITQHISRIKEESAIAEFLRDY